MSASTTAPRKTPEMMLTLEEAKQVVSLCCEGKLYEIEEWIRTGKSLHVPPECKRSPLQIALDRGFHSLVDLLARNDVGQEAKNVALGDAVSKRHLEFVELLVKHGAEISSVSFSDVLLSWQPTLIRFFLEHGADFISEFPFAQAFRARIRTALRPFIECKQKHPELADRLQDQADRAIRYFCHEGNLKWISLMMWVGANPRAAGPNLDDEDDPECYTTGLREACYGGKVEVLKKLKPHPDRDDMTELLRCAATSARSDAVQYLLELGACPNNQPNGGSSALDSCLWHLNFNGSFFDKRRKSLYDVRGTLDLIHKLVDRGALWKPDSASRVKELRRTLFQCDPTVTVELIRILKKHESCSDETIQDVVNSPRMREHLASQRSKLAKWFKKKDIPNGNNCQASVSFSLRAKKTESVSPSCALMRRYSRETLHDEVWVQPMQKLSKKYGISDVGLAKVCRKLGVPLPGLGYWAKKAAGKVVRKRPALAPLQKNSAAY